MYHLMDTNQLLRLARDVDMGEYERAVVERLDDYDRRLKEIDDVLDNFYLHSDPSLLTYELTKMQEELQQYKEENAELRAEIDNLTIENACYKDENRELDNLRDEVRKLREV